MGTQIEKLTGWEAPSTIVPTVQRMASVSPAQAAALNARWPALVLDALSIRTVTGNAPMGQLRHFQQLNPLFVEIFLTDSRG